jgi:hypothetical protein
MADIALTTASDTEIDIVGFPETQLTVPAAEAISAGNAVRFDATTGKFTKANGTTTTEANIYGIATRTVAAGEAVTAVRRGVLDGFALSGRDFGAPIYLSDTDGALGETAGTVSTIVGRVIPGTSTTLGTTFDKLLFVNLA